MNVERAGEAWDHLQDVQGRLAEAAPAAQGRFHAAAGTAAYWFGDHDSAIDETVLALAVLAGEPPTAARALALAASGVVLAYTRLFPLAAEVMAEALTTAGQAGLPTARFHVQAQYVQLTWGMSLDHLGLREQCQQRWAEVERHHRLATAEPAALPDSMLALTHAERALLAARLGDPVTARDHLGLARAVGAEARSPSLRRLLAHAEGATLAAEGRLPEARRVLLELWESVRDRAAPRTCRCCWPGSRRPPAGCPRPSGGTGRSTPAMAGPSRSAGRPGRPRPGCGSSRRRCCGGPGSWSTTRCPIR
jgi:hypothetical protein